MRRATPRHVLLFIFAVSLSGSSLATPRAKPEPESAAASLHGAGARTAEIPGRYAILRSGKDTGCMLTLEPARAQLAPACRDNGIVIFDPKGWSYAGGHLILRARKGHSASFDRDENGVWERDNKKDGGKPLALRKM